MAWQSNVMQDIVKLDVYKYEFACDVCEYKNLPIITTSGENTNSKTPHLAIDTTDDLKGKTQRM